MAQIIVLLALVFSTVIAVFAVQNTTAVDVQFLTLRATAVAVSVLVLIAAAFGALVMLLLGVAREVSLRWHHPRGVESTEAGAGARRGARGCAARARRRGA
ncbi:MAG: DUF1049 domain-containing protein [Chloroflexi bacterium]|nr:DUF1049 domain-containing protein [Chloroflexota bacterium]